jgi:VanZ family protein
LVRWLFPHATDEAIHEVIVFVRKSAHVGEYAVLALLVWHARRKALGVEPRAWHWSNEVRTIFLVMLYAAADEFHQLFVPSRQASVWDVLLDTSGAVFALLLLWGLGRWRKRW